MTLNHRTAPAAASALVLLCCTANAQATPSTQIWIPSTDIQKFATVHLNFDSFLRIDQEDNGGRLPPTVMLGPTVGVLPWEKVQAEVGLDWMVQGSAILDRYPFYFHGKLGTPEDSMFKWSPAIAAGMYNIGYKPKLTTQDIAYGLVARTFPYVGRLSAGYYFGNDAILVDAKGNRANHGILASWDRTMKELSDKLWLAVDYQGGNSSLGTLNFGGSWNFAENVSVLVGYDLYLNRVVAGKDTVTVQVDINIRRGRRWSPDSASVPLDLDVFLMPRAAVLIIS